MKVFITLLFITLLMSCEKEDDRINIQIEDIINYTFIDPNEDPGNIPDTVYYDFKPDNKMTKILYDYELNNTSIELVKIDTIQCIYFLENNSLFTTYDLSEPTLINGFGINNLEWNILKLNSDTMIIDLYTINVRQKVGHRGFIVADE